MTRLKSVIACTGLILGSTLAFAQSSTEAVEPAVAASTSYNFTEVNFTNDTFTQLLAINSTGVIAGYHGSGLDPAHPNQGFTVTLSSNGTPTFTAMNYPKSVQTQVVGIDNLGHTSGFYVDTNNLTHGFFQHDGVFSTVNFPLTTFNQLLSANNNDQAAGYSQDSKGNFHPYVWNRSSPFLSLLLLNSVSAQATGINDGGAISGFSIDPKGVTHGFLFIKGRYVILNYPGSTGTQALGVNNNNLVVGSYTDATANTHGFVYNFATNKYQQVDDPNGIGTTLINGINDAGTLVGFWGNTAGGISHGFVATVQP